MAKLSCILDAGLFGETVHVGRYVLFDMEYVEKV